MDAHDELSLCWQLIVLLMLTFSHFFSSILFVYMFTSGRRQSRNVDQKSLETEFSVAIWRHTGDKLQSKTLFLSIFDPCSSIVDSVFDCRLPGEMLALSYMCIFLLQTWRKIIVKESSSLTDYSRTGG